MTANSKLSIAFSALAAVFLAAGVAAIYLIGQSEPRLREVTLANQRLVHLSQAIQSLREHPDDLAEHSAWLTDLAKLWTDSTAITEAQELLAGDHNAARAVGRLEALQRQYQATAADASQRLVALRDLAVITTTAAIAAAVGLIVMLMFLTRVWLVYPLRDLRAACLAAATGQPTPVRHPDLADAGQALQQLVSDSRVHKERAEHAERLASVGEACSHVTNSLHQALRSVATIARYEGEAEHVDPNAKAAFQYIIATVNKLDAWVRNLHLTIGAHRLQAASQPIEPILRDVLSLLQPNLRDNAVAITLLPAESLPNVSLDRPRFEQALLAVLGNAIEASPPSGTVTVRTRNHEDHAVIIEIEDQGAGMSEATRERAFDPFFTTKRDNVGLGLTMAYRVITQHGGQLTLAPGAKGGTRVSIQLPAA